MLHDGTRLALAALAPEPGYGMVTVTPEPGDEDLPEQLIVPLGSIVRIELRRAAERRGTLGFTLPQD